MIENQYAVKIMPLAEGHIKKIADYISFQLMAPLAADNWLVAVGKQIKSLSTFPSSHPLVDKEPWRSKGVRKLLIKNFIAYFKVDEEKKLVSVIGVVYGKTDQLKQLKQMKF